jgi:hypothetical protein
MESESLRKIANELRQTAAALEQQKMIKCAQAIQAATALNLLREKVRAHVR